jgi:pimeloyl-ACP methyl ester carboxylesterase
LEGYSYSYCNQFIAKMKSKMLKPAFLSLLVTIGLVLPKTTFGQNIEKISFDKNDYYLAVRPASNHIQGTIVFLCSFRPPESLLPETKLHNVAFANDLLTVYVSMGKQLYADSLAVDRLNRVMENVLKQYGADSSKVVLGGFDFGGTIALRYAELAAAHPEQFPVHPKAVFAAASFTDLAGLYQYADRWIKKNPPHAVGDGSIIMDMLNKEPYERFSPFSKDQDKGNEYALRNLPVRLYYDTDIAWQLSAKGNSLYDTPLPDGSEMIRRLLAEGDQQAAFIASKQPGVRSNGIRSASSLSIIDEVDCIQWIKAKLHIFDPNNPLAYEAPYTLPKPAGWTIARNLFPPPWAPGLSLKGIEEISFAPGWGNAKAEDYWSLLYLFWLDAGQSINAAVLQTDLKTYYDGLIAGNASKADMESHKVATNITIKQTKTAFNDSATYTGTVCMLDYMALQPITLNYIVHVKNGKLNHHQAVIMELSPQPYGKGIWSQLNAVNDGFAAQ